MSSTSCFISELIELGFVFTKLFLISARFYDIPLRY